MLKLERILVPTDFSELSANAADVACDLAQVTGATIHLAHVARPVEVAFEVPEIGVLRRRVPPDEAVLKERLAEFARQHFAAAGVPVVAAILSGRPARALARYAHTARIDRIIIGTHADGILRRLTHGSVSKFILEHAPCPVVMVPPPRSAPRRRDRTGDDLPSLLPAAT